MTRLLSRANFDADVEAAIAELADRFSSHPPAPNADATSLRAHRLSEGITRSSALAAMRRALGD